MSIYDELVRGGETIVTVFRRVHPWAAWHMDGRFKLATAVTQYGVKPGQLKRVVDALAERRSWEFRNGKGELRFAPPRSDEEDRYSVGP